MAFMQIAACTKFGVAWNPLFGLRNPGSTQRDLRSMCQFQRDIGVISPSLTLWSTNWGSEHSKGTPWSDSDQFGCTQWLTPPSKTEIEMSRCQIPDTHFDLEQIFSVCLFWVCLVGFLYSFGSKRTKTISQKQFGQIWKCQWCFRVRIRLNWSRC